ncbi:MAG TPA: hypothetical protein VNB22_22900 [Pyrinomonadaceae bacterium]|nr:hypothetical protein [Pyrinomonadaceae bacterium]
MRKSALRKGFAQMTGTEQIQDGIGANNHFFFIFTDKTTGLRLISAFARDSFPDPLPELFPGSPEPSVRAVFTISIARD